MIFHRMKTTNVAFFWGSSLCFVIFFSCHKEHRHEHKEEHHDKENHAYQGEIKLKPSALKKIGIETYQIKRKPINHQQISAVGRVTLPPSGISKVGSRAEGRLVRWYVALGQHVKRGQALAILDSPTVGRIRAKFLQSHALHHLEKIEFQRMQRLKKTGLASEKMLLAARMRLQRAEIKLRATSAQLRILGLTVPKNKKLEKLTGRFVLTAPSSGEVTKMSHHLGAWVKPQSSILQIESRQQVWILLEIYAQDVSRVRMRQTVHLYGPGIEPHRKGRISYLASRFERGAQTLEARVVISNKDGFLRPNQFLHALIDIGMKSKRSTHANTHILIPEDAIQRLGQTKVVFIPGTEPGHFQVRTVVVTEAAGDQVKVLYGLKPGERIIVKGSFILKSELMRNSLETEHGH